MSEDFLRIRYGTKENGALIKKAVVYTRDEHRINNGNVDRDAVFIVSRLKAAGFESYIVGGAVRDLMLDKKPKDFDIVTGATPAHIKKLFRNSRIIGRRFRLVHVYFGPRIFEVSTFRSIKDGHTGNTYGTIEEDVLRRDFSINALFYDPENQVVVDYVGGMKDIRKRLIRPVIPAGLIFNDDPVRMIRAVKYAAATGFSIPWLLRRRIKKEAPLLAEISPSRRTEELSKIIRSPHASSIVENLEEAGLYAYLQSEASALLKSNPSFRARYFRSLRALDALNEGNEEPAGGTRIAAFIRDYLDDAYGWDSLAKTEKTEKNSAPLREACKDVFYTARRFILPVNPPRMDLEQAVRLIFSEHGFDLKKIRLFEGRHTAGRPAFARPRPGADPIRVDPGGGTENKKINKDAKPENKKTGEDAYEKPRRRRHRGKKPALPPGADPAI
jgi:poly(A) polymerase